MDDTVREAIEIIQLIFPGKTTEELQAKYGLDKSVKRSVKNNWIVLDFGEGRIFSNPMGRIWNAIQDIATGDTTEEYLKSIAMLMNRYKFPKEYAGYYTDPETKEVKSYKTGKVISVGSRDI
ncbi:MAG: hypothetical protein LBF63_05990 [Treponema sp.]|jgi:hypothetical protein|nr:hypothetical protein [Treponema sp.]